MPDAGVSLRDLQIAARHADPRTTMRYDRARTNLDRHPNYILAPTRPPEPDPAVREHADERAHESSRRETTPTLKRLSRLSMAGLTRVAAASRSFIDCGCG
jgi:hypothetical protein